MLKSVSPLKHYLSPSLTVPRSPLGVVLIGLGGNGGPILTELGRMDVALRALGHPGLHVEAFDDDTVQEPNIGRQLFSRAEKRRNKAECLVTRVNCFFGLNWRAHPYRVDEDVMSAINDSFRRRHAQIIITAVDNPEARLLVHNSLKDVGPVYYLDMGNAKETGQAILGIIGGVVKQPKREGCISYLPTTIDLYPDIAQQSKEDRQGPSCSIKEALDKQDLYINRIVSTFAVELLWRGLREGFISTHGVYVNLNTMHVRPLTVDPAVWKRMGWVHKTKRSTINTQLKAAA